eukprot:scaffold2214_cov139-Cylindrotheca_fusiformis.AAC.10
MSFCWSPFTCYDSDSTIGSLSGQVRDFSRPHNHEILIKTKKHRYNFAKLHSKMIKKHVAFGNVEIIELPYTVGNGPASEGAPVSIGWEPIERNMFKVEFFEAFRPPRRTKPALRMSATRRKYLLLRNGHSLDEIEEGEQEAIKLRKERSLAIRMQRKLDQADMKSMTPVAA